MASLDIILFDNDDNAKLTHVINLKYDYQNFQR